ncbi:apolipoprotein N-acyltransferase [Helicobacter sp. MIT 21-1697]|uniref:apolipoprotein N-acyltransferase n=1 Tax=Helicobacter sp. MIT 21-1697 TaxID=2993733 RepID=UPI00224A51B1|nr:apolipoprotein N-acyltransferase [Helicobacter sp. MIT 21-1697]MCX2717260.1 apolipoprotein N-acyltransferase [Helicobacter sp. MIT 21-1697]
MFFHTSYIRFSWRNPQTYKPTLLWLFISLIFAFLFVLPFYVQWILEIYEKTIPPLLASLLGLLSIASMLFAPKNRRFSIGFFLGVLWFYWVSLGLRYFDMSFLIPLVVIACGIFMGFVFYIGLWCECLMLRFAFLLLLSYLTPFGFDWIVPESVFAYSYIGVDKLSFALVILALWLLFKYKSWWKLGGVICLILALDFGLVDSQRENLPQFKIKLAQSAVSQDFDYRMREAKSIFDTHISDIQKAINEKYDVIILPESAFYVPLDSPYFVYFDTLLEMSHKIIIIAGALREEIHTDGSASYFNSTYKFDKGEVSFYDKVLLVPFGETLPSFLLPLAHTFFQGIGGFSAGRDFGYFDIKGIQFKNAICYEGSNRGFYSDYPQYVIVTSNNAWFVPSIEPILQKNLMKYYARLYGSVIFHATNLSPAAIITPFVNDRLLRANIKN